MKLFLNCLAFAGLIVTGFPGLASTNMLSTLVEQKDLTPESLIRSFAGFTFELNAQRQDPETFLQRKRGDCDDFASLASQLLTSRGYKTKLVMVMMQDQTHVVCYVDEAHGFLDFNHRADAQPVVESNGTLEGMAEKISADFRSPWHLASEFRYEKGSPIYLNNVFPFARRAANSVAMGLPKTSTTSRTNAVPSIPAHSSVPAGSPVVAQASKLSLP